ncbi:YibE/F family protein [Rhodococcus sp. 2H158]
MRPGFRDATSPRSRRYPDAVTRAEPPGHGHGHGHFSGPIPVGPTAAKVVVGLLVAIGVAVFAGAVALWPSGQAVDIPAPFQTTGGGAVVTEAGTVVEQDIGPCGSSSAGRPFTGDPVPPATDAYQCQRSIVTIDSGPNEGTRTLLEIGPGPGQPDLRVGEEIRLVRQVDPSGATQYSFYDYSRGLPLALIITAFVVVIVAVARWRGLRALIGLLVAFGVLVVFMLPALLDGKPAVPVALVGGAIILYAVLYLAHGVNLRTSSALLGTLASMLLAALLSYLAIWMTHLTGLSEEQNTDVQLYLEQVSITGLLLAGFIIGSLGVLNDVTITQAASAFELAALDPTASRRKVFSSAMRVGRDHIASTVYTLVLAYAGGALPLLLLFSVAGRSISDVLTGDAVAIEVVRACVGGIALALSVPLTTGIAALLARPGAQEPVAHKGRHAR